MGAIVDYDPYTKKFSFSKDSRWIETLWAVIYSENLSETAKIVFASIMPHVYNSPLIFPSQKELSEAVHKSPSTVKRAIRELKHFKLIEVPPGFQERQNKYVIYEHGNSDLKFSGKAEQLMSDLLNIKISEFAVTTGVKSATGVINDPSPQEKKETKEKEEKKSNIKEKKKENKKEKRELAASASVISSKSDSNTKRRKMAKISSTTSVKHSSAYGFAEEERPSLTDVMQKSTKVTKKLPDDVHSWSTVNFAKYFQHCYHKKFGRKLKREMLAKENTLIKGMIKRTTDVEDIKEVIDFLFEHWEVISKKFGFEDQLPTISLLFSNWYGTFEAMMHKGAPKGKRSFAEKRSDYEFKMPKGLVERM